MSAATKRTFSQKEMYNRKKAGGCRRPLLLLPEEKNALWGGDRLYSVKGGAPRRIAELWVLSVRGDVNTKIADSTLTLADYIRTVGGDTVAPDYHPDDRFPLLLKILDAAKPLSVQVHPDDSYAEQVGGDSGKSEMWYVLHAEPKAEILYGMKNGLTAADFAEAVKEGRTLDAVSARKISAGESYYVPAGLLHALGGGITVAEIQQNSDITYRLYDYGRTDQNGQMRELHLVDGLRVLRPYGEDELTVACYEAANEEPSDRLLADTDKFRVRCVLLDEQFCDCADSYFRAVLALTDLTVQSQDCILHVPRFHAVFVPAGVGEYTVKGEALVADADRLLGGQ